VLGILPPTQDLSVNLPSATELRDFPFLFGASGSELEDLCGRALANTPRLHKAIWTRSGGLSDQVLAALHAIPALRALEINGGARGYSAPNLLQFDNLESLAIIMPDRPVSRILADWLQRLAPQLKELSLICKVNYLNVTQDRCP